jgi:hypothetical protein
VGLIHADLTSPFFFSVISLSGVVIVDHDSCGTTGTADIFAAHPLLRSQNQNRALRKGWGTLSFDRNRERKTTREAGAPGTL